MCVACFGHDILAVILCRTACALSVSVLGSQEPTLLSPAAVVLSFIINPNTVLGLPDALKYLENFRKKCLCQTLAGLGLVRSAESLLSLSTLPIANSRRRGRRILQASASQQD